MLSTWGATKGFNGVINQIGVAASVAYSLRLVNSLYTGALINLRSSNDQSIKDFFPTGPGKTLNASEVTAFCNIGATDGVFTGTIATTVLTVVSVTSGKISIGDSVTGPGVTAGTLIISNGTGSGGAGTYNINISQSIVVGVSMTTTLNAFSTKWYDQSGNSKDASQGTSANQPLFSLTAFNTFPAIVGADDVRLLQSGNLTIAQPMSISFCAMRTAFGAGRDKVAQADSGSVLWGFASSANQAELSGGTSLVVAATDNAPHVVLGVLNGISSTVTADSTSASGDAGAGTFSATPIDIFFVNNSLVGPLAELLIFPSALSASNSSLLISNQRSFYGV